ncbi:hypothetical protein BJ170DRAFT_681001 [Xylariales sp. AK1849]|nr:hypothetical protein BJ170DRAFT_681001 [Xylariales sp. AK1849]
MSRWELSSWLILIRGLQILGTLVSAILNGFLLVYVHINRLGLSSAMFSLEILVGFMMLTRSLRQASTLITPNQTCITLCYTAIVLLVQHTGSRRLRARPSLIVTFVVGDIVFTGIMIVVISILARTGVPSNCAGLTRSDFEDSDAPNNPDDGYGTVRFGSGSGDDKGMLDHFCALERSYYFISIAIVFSYMATVTLSILRICEGLYTKNSVVDERLTTASELVRLESKLSKTHRPSLIRHSGSPTSPLQEGITSPRSPRSFSSRHSFRDQAPAQRRTNTLPVSPLQSSPTITIDPAREGLLIEQRNFSDQHGADEVAEAAMVTDGYRGPTSQGRMPVLPPYTPGENSRFMAGHGNESNEMRLSEYVKGETRAQNMKDSGGFGS